MFATADSRLAAAFRKRLLGSCTFLLLAGLWMAPPHALADDSAERPAVANAAEQDNPKEVQAAVAEGADVNMPQPDGMTALHWTVYHNRTELSKWLIKKGANVNASNQYQVRPLSLACQAGNAAIVTALIEAGADLEAALPGGETPLLTAARTGRPEAVAVLLKHGANVQAAERSRQTAIMWAAAEGHNEVVQLLLKHQADFRAALPSGFSPLMFAVREGRPMVVKTLIDAGADPNRPMKCDSKGKGPRNGTTPLIMAVENGHFELAMDLLEAGANPNDQRNGYTALHVLTWVRKPNRGDGPDGEPAPIGSGSMTSLEFAEELIQRGARVDERLKRGRSGRGRLDLNGATPLLMAAKTADLPLIRLLLKHGADPHTTNAVGTTPLLAAAGIGTIAPGEEAGTEEEAIEAVKLFLKLGADLNHVDRNGETAMHGAAYKSMPSVVRLLAQRGARAETWLNKNKYGWNPVMIAEGHRVGNFKPSIDTLRMLHQVLRESGVAPPPPTPRIKRKGYDQ